MFKLALGVLALSVLWSNDTLASDNAGVFFDQIKNTKNTFSVPDSRAIISTVKNQQVVILDNPRYVVKGQVFDTWLKEEVKSKEDLLRFQQYFPFSQLKLNKADLFDNDVENADYVLFIDPLEEPNAVYKKLKASLPKNKTTQIVYTIDINSKSQSELQQYMGFSCVHNGVDFNKENPFPLEIKEEKEPCDNRIYNTVGLSMLLKVNPPLLVDISTGKILPF